MTTDAKGRITAAANNLVTADITDAVAQGGSSSVSKAIKTDATGELDDTFLKDQLAASDDGSAALGTKAGSFDIATVTVDQKGRITNVVGNPSTVTGGTASDSGKLVKLNANGLIDETLIPDLAIGELYSTSSASDLGLGSNTSTADTFIATNTIKSGDVVVLTTTVPEGTSEADRATLVANDGTYMYVKNHGSSTGAFVRITTPGNAVMSVNGHDGPIITLATNDVAETSAAASDLAAGSASDTVNRYFTQARVKAYTDSISVRDTFTDGEHVCLDSDSYVISGGSATSGTIGA